MSTAYPVKLPEVPTDRWNCRIMEYGGDSDEGAAWIRVELRAESAVEAETRVLAVLAKDYEDDLRGAVATAEGYFATVQLIWGVRVALARPRG